MGYIAYSECDLGCENVSSFFGAVKEKMVDGRKEVEWAVRLCKGCMVRLAGKKFVDKNRKVLL